MINPLDGIITSSFGERINPITNKKEFHDGIDIAAKEGTKILAVSDGTVENVGNSSGFGNFIVYKTDEGYQIKCAHLKKIFVTKNERLKQNQVIALSGKSGMVTGPHLHFSIRFESELVDPINFVSLPYTDDVKKEYAMRGANLF